MLVIRQAQISALGRHARAEFEAQMCDLFVRSYPRECRQAGGPAAMAGWVAHCLQAAVASGFQSKYACSRWLLLAMMLGIDFAVDPQLPWVQDCLDPGNDPESSDRIDRLFGQSLEYLGTTAGEDAEFVVRAMLRLRAFDFASVPELQGQAAIDAACDRMSALYPEKFAFQGLELTLHTVSMQLRRATDRGLTGAAGGFLFVVLSFMLGSGFDHDPLHPWAGEILHAAFDPPGLADRATRLEAAARKHMALSLTKGQA
jgi:hypothetical protein